MTWDEAKAVMAAGGRVRRSSWPDGRMGYVSFEIPNYPAGPQGARAVGGIAYWWLPSGFTPRWFNLTTEADAVDWVKL